MKKLIEFIKESRERGFDDYLIREALLKKGWPENIIDEAFLVLHKKRKQREKFESKVTIYLSKDIQKALEKRAKKNMLTLPEQIEDILRRSVVSGKKTTYKPEKLDDTLVGLFSRRQRKRK